ncbi:hypothetical protein L9F63_010333, partial [Diploptera punctata]
SFRNQTPIKMIQTINKFVIQHISYVLNLYKVQFNALKSVHGIFQHVKVIQHISYSVQCTFRRLE